MGDAAGRTTARPIARRTLLVALGALAFAVAAVVLVNSSDELLAAADTLTTLNWAWVAVAVVAEIGSYWARGAAGAAVLRCGVDGDAAAPGATVLGAATWAGDAAAYCLPFGFAASGVVTVRALVRRGVSGAIATWTFAISTVFYVGSVGVLTVLAVQIAGDRDPIPGLEALTYGLLTVLGLLVVGYVVGRRSHMIRAWRLGRARRRASTASDGTPTPTPQTWRRAGAAVARWWHEQAAQLRSVRLPVGVAVLAFALMMVSWVADIAVLGIAYAALDAPPPWVGLLLAYCAGQVAAAVPVTPGGIGVVEGSLTLALVAFGGAETITLAAVLLYRLIAYWGCIPLGGLAWLGLRATAPASTADGPA